MSIIIGSDELILHIRKNYTNCTKSNSDLGREIMQWINKKEHNSDSRSKKKKMKCLWGNSEEITSATTLPRTATQFQISDENFLNLYKQLKNIANG